MIAHGSLEFAQARLQARHGQRPSESDWQRLEVAREFAAVLDAARSCALRRWVVGLTRSSTPDQIEAALRLHWRAQVAELAAWMPQDWQPALAWCAPLPDLPVWQHLARGGDAAPWMVDDAAVRPWCAPGAAGRAAALEHHGQGASAGAAASPVDLAPAWLAQWRRLCPGGPAAGGDALRALLAALTAHGAAFSALRPGQAGQARLLRRALHGRLSLLLRASTLEPAAAFIHLALCALDFERLRGELLDRALFPGAKAA